MNTTLSVTDGPADLTGQEKRDLLTVLSETVWEIEAMLAQAKEAWAEVMTSLQSDLRAGARRLTAPCPEYRSG